MFSLKSSWDADSGLALHCLHRRRISQDSRTESSTWLCGSLACNIVVIAGLFWTLSELTSPTFDLPYLFIDKLLKTLIKLLER